MAGPKDLGLPPNIPSAAAAKEAGNADRPASSRNQTQNPPPTAAAASQQSSLANTANSSSGNSSNSRSCGSGSSSSSSRANSSSSSEMGRKIRITHTAQPPPSPSASILARSRKKCDGSTRRSLSELLSRNTAIAAGKYACGGKLTPRIREWYPRVKLKAMPASLSLPLTFREATRLKESQIEAGQERDVNMDGVPETRLPWAVRPGADFKIVNNKMWTTMVVAPVLKQVSGVDDSGVDDDGGGGGGGGGGGDGGGAVCVS